MEDKTINEYLYNSNWRTKENANWTYSFSGLKHYIDSKTLANYALNRVSRKARKCHVEGDFHIHNLESGFLIRYCSGNSLQQLLFEGLWTPSIASKPPKHFSSALDQIVNFLYVMQMEVSGAVAFNDVDVLLAPFIRHDSLSYKEVKQNIQRMVFNLNYTLRSSGQTPFTNFSFDYKPPKYLENEPVILGGELLNSTYGDYQKEIDMFNVAFNEVLLEKDVESKPFTFPIPTLNCTKHLDWNSEALNMLLIEDLNLGSWYFMNYVGSGIPEDTVRAMCCRLNIDMGEVAKARGLWNFGDSTGSIGVVTINMARLGYLYNDEDKLLERLEELMNIAKEVLLVKEQIVKKMYELGLTPVTKHYKVNYDNYFRTIGEIGLNELCLNLTGKGLYYNKSLGYKILKFMRDKTVEFQKETGKLFNLEMTPGEGCSYRLAYIDRKKYPNIKTLGTKKAPYYTSLLIPPSEEVDVFDRLTVEEDLLPLFTGGTVFRVFIGEEVNVLSSFKQLIFKLLNSKIPYFDVTRTFSVCVKEKKFFQGVHEKCPSCGGNCEIFSRVVGYYRPVSRWNIGKQQEFKDRKYVNRV